MNFNLVLRYLLDIFEQNDIKYALIGGFALSLHGYIRSTIDLDIMIPSKDLPPVEEFLLNHGYNILIKNEDVVCYTSNRFELGRVDFLLAHRKYTLNMLNNTVLSPYAALQKDIHIISVEDLIGLKLQAYENRKERTTIDLDDIKNLIRLKKPEINYQKIKEYFELFNETNLLKEIWSEG